ncbi:adenosine kinase 2 [Ischnura elegans]|uniref:adenosine kinase 2 n=1 Tax=Ischnura elegans TaxID=197161 RepID=UPI001ED87040|nr:adenosine kinase 2 [Ischnura elegans]
MGDIIKEGQILGLGNPLLDMTIAADEEFLAKYDLKPNDAILAEEKHIPLYQEMVDKYEVDYSAGGATLNALEVAQWIIGKPYTAVFMGCIGRDFYSTVLEDRAKEKGVNGRFQYNSEKPTGTCAVVLTNNGANRSLCANLAAANCFTIDHLRKPDNFKFVENAKMYYISGFFLTVSPDSILEVANYALSKNRLFMMNLSAPFICHAFSKQLMDVFPFIDILFGNDCEAAAFGASQNIEYSNLQELALKMSNLEKRNTNRSRIIIITQGGNPTIVAKDGAVKEYPAPQLPAEKIVDTNGAGDAFVGGFLAKLVADKPIETCLRAAFYTATHVIQRVGCTCVGTPDEEILQD